MVVGDMRNNNERAVLAAIAITPGSSGAQLARATGLGPPTIARLVADLETEGLIMRGPVLRGQRGQPATPLFLNPEGAYSIGCELGWRHIELVLRDFSGTYLAHHRRDFEFPDLPLVLDEIASLTRLMVGTIPEAVRTRVIGLGIAMPGTIGRNIHLLGGTAADARAWDDLDVGAALHSATGIETFVYNDGSAGCWATLAALPAPRPANLAYLLVGTFVASGVLVDGRLWEGPNLHAGDLGALLVNDQDNNYVPVHRLASIYALRERLVAAGIASPAGHPSTWAWDAIEPVASEWLEEAGLAMALAVCNANAVTDCELAIIDGIMPAAIVQRLVERVRHHLNALLNLTRDPPEVRIGTVGAVAPARGAALLPIFRRFFGSE